MAVIKDIRVRHPNWVRLLHPEVYYLVIDDIVFEKYGELVKRAPDQKFFDAVGKYVTAYTDDGEMPPAAIAPAIINIADDIRSGRPATLRAGDYISLQSFIKSGPKAVQE